MNNLFSSLPQFGMIGAVALIAFISGMLYQRNLILDADNKSLLEWANSQKVIYDTLHYDAQNSDIKNDGSVAPVLRDTIDRLPIPTQKPKLPTNK